ncbi:MAG: hypothetical protein IJC16_02600, partial [Rikenellaceae bacterium]|nr:hypothetical protein [Rikenellaceae bacterium]
MGNIVKWLFAACLLAALAGCEKTGGGEDPPGEGDEKINRAVYSLLSEWYLWNDEVKAKTPDYTLAYNRFFTSLLSDKDGKPGLGYFSRISRESVSKAGTETSLGFEFTIPLEVTGYGMLARVLYVYPGSPADGKLERGDWIGEINGERISYANYYDFYTTGTAVLTRVTATPTTGNMVSIARRDEVQVTAGPTDMNPILLSKVLPATGGPVAYLVYNAFETGPNSYRDKTYDNQLKAIFRDFKSQGVSELVLDLRYNGGGYVTSSQLLASMIVPSSLLGSGVFVKQVYNRDKNRTDVMQYLGSGVVGDCNLDLSRVFVLTGYRTASASELIINSLRGQGVDVVLIGDRTVGKNVGSEEHTLTFDGYKYVVNPIMFRSYNAQDWGAYEDGFAPDHAIDEEDGFPVWHGLGDPAEAMLGKALALIAGTATADAARTGGVLPANARRTG